MKTRKNKNEIDKIKKREGKIMPEDLRFEQWKHKSDLQQYETIRSFSENIYTSKINVDNAEMDQTNLSKKSNLSNIENIVNFNNKSRAKTKEG